MFIRHSVSAHGSLRWGMPNRLRRCYGGEYLHFVTSSCYHRRPILGTAQRRSLFLELLEQVRRRYGFVVVGYVVMPEHFHLLFSEPEKGTPSTVMQVLKQRFARKILKKLRARGDPAQGQLWDEALAEGHVWQRRFYDFVVWSHAKRLEKLRYIHRNPVKRGLVLEPAQWSWSSFRHYAYGEAGPVLVDEQQPAKLKFRNLESNGSSRETILPTRKKQEWGSFAASPHSHPCIKRKGGAASD
jgi:putative transposase